MAYFSNGTDGICFDEQCSLCRYGQWACPIWLVQINFNYKACNNKVASEILKTLVKDDGTCEMFKVFKKDFALTAGEKAQQKFSFGG